MPAFRELTEEDVWRTVAFVRSLGFSGPADEEPRDAAAAAMVSTLRSVRERLRVALDDYDSGRHDEASEGALDAYILFEGIEAQLLSRDPEGTKVIESDFLALRSTLRDASDPAAARAQVERVSAGLERLAAAGTGTQGPLALFLNSLAIILREGFEAILIIAALVAFLRKSGNGALVRHIVRGALAAVAASFATAFALRGIFQLGIAQQETLEGFTLLLASAVLFGVSYWLFTKIYVEEWHTYLRGKVEKALQSGSRWALASVAFLAVYREGFETVLFYQALLVENSGALAIPAGFVTGCGGLAVIYYLLHHAGKRIPIRQFFFATGAILYLMGFIFAGQG
ncbi:MAG: FTR1 family iron permease, partial [Vicinamibacteria bacterium]